MKEFKYEACTAPLTSSDPWYACEDYDRKSWYVNISTFLFA